jgi:hypothetical protein
VEFFVSDSLNKAVSALAVLSKRLRFDRVGKRRNERRKVASQSNMPRGSRTWRLREMGCIVERADRDFMLDPGL